MKLKLQQAIANYSSTSTDVMCSPRPKQLTMSRPPSSAVAYTELETHVRFYNNFNPLICELHELRIWRFWPKTMVGTQKNYITWQVIWSCDRAIQQTSDFVKR